MRYKEEETKFESEDILYFYTDWVTEAVTPEQEFFSEARLLELSLSIRKSRIYGNLRFRFNIENRCLYPGSGTGG